MMHGGLEIWSSFGLAYQGFGLGADLWAVGVFGIVPRR
jgi:hypothetical protein